MHRSHDGRYQSLFISTSMCAITYRDCVTQVKHCMMPHARYVHSLTLTLYKVACMGWEGKGPHKSREEELCVILAILEAGMWWRKRQEQERGSRAYGTTNPHCCAPVTAQRCRSRPRLMVAVVS